MINNCSFIQVCLIATCLISCQQTSTENPDVDTEQGIQTSTMQSDSSAFIHTVFFWMNDDVTDQQKEEFEIKGLDEIAKIETIYRYYYGPAAQTEREVVDNSYDFAWICHFKSKHDHDLYQEDPIHLKFIEDFKNLWKEVKVYDNLVKI